MRIRSPIINVMVRAATKAGRHLRRDFGEIEHLQVSKKGPADFVSSADLRSEKIIKEELSKARPDFGFIMEESGEVSSDSECRWIVDPLDGTTNFLHGIPHFAISIAMQENEEIKAGIIYDPVNDHLYWAEKGLGAFLNDTRLRVSGRHEIHECVLATGIPWKGRVNEEEIKLFSSELNWAMHNLAGVRRFGTASLDLAFVAAGRFDGFWERHLNIWDIAAGILLVKEAGGYVGSLSKDDVLKSGHILATNGEIYSDIEKTLKSINQ